MQRFQKQKKQSFNVILETTKQKKSYKVQFALLPYNTWNNLYQVFQ